MVMDYREQMNFAVNKTRENLADYVDDFPSVQSKGYVYQHDPCTDWTSGFFPGMEMLSYEYTKDPVFLEQARHHVGIFRHRIDNKIAVDHHDMGFLYSLSCVSVYKVTGDEYAKETALLAARHLLGRYNPTGRFIQAWESMDNPTANRLIIDCLMNIPLLFWAAEETGEIEFREVAVNHLNTTLKVIIREDNTTHHTYFFDVVTGAPSHGKTDQGYSDESCWARGQAWGIYGTALAYHYTRDEKVIEAFHRVTGEFIRRLPADYIPYWDMDFSDGSGEPRDTSAAAIAACGIMEMSKYMDCTEYLPYVDKMLTSLREKFTSARLENSNVILTDAMYGRPRGDEPEGNIYGDYFYMEALMRKLDSQWKMYW